MVGSRGDQSGGFEPMRANGVQGPLTVSGPATGAAARRLPRPGTALHGPCSCTRLLDGVLLIAPSASETKPPRDFLGVLLVVWSESSTEIRLLPEDQQHVDECSHECCVDEERQVAEEKEETQQESHVPDVDGVSGVPKETCGDKTLGWSDRRCRPPTLAGKDSGTVGVEQHGAQHGRDAQGLQRENSPSRQRESIVESDRERGQKYKSPPEEENRGESNRNLASSHVPTAPSNGHRAQLPARLGQGIAASMYSCHKVGGSSSP